MADYQRRWKLFRIVVSLTLFVLGSCGSTGSGAGQVTDRASRGPGGEAKMGPSTDAAGSLGIGLPAAKGDSASAGTSRSELVREVLQAIAESGAIYMADAGFCEEWEAEVRAEQSLLTSELVHDSGESAKALLDEARDQRETRRTGA